MNRFFQLALRKAALAGRKKGRLLVLLTQLSLKLKQVDWRNANISTAAEKFLVLGRMIKAYASGQYREIQWKNILLIIAAIIYFVNPIDLLPDMLPITGLTDDLGVLLWVYNTLSKEIEKFLIWEKSQLTS